jgi:tryptophanyl-tRNA synthetase
MENEKKKVILSGIKPTGQLTIGNYIGAMKNFIRLQDDYDTLYMVADLHALTVPQEPKELRQKTLSVIAQYIAVGLDPERSNLFIQSHVIGHTELSWILGCMTGLGELGRMTQFKDKSSKPGANINAGLFTYPVLMASDILLYNADYVPVGEDQKQHVELTRDIAIKFNHRYSDTFIVPEPIIPKSGARIMDLQNPLAKMGKSDSGESGRIALTDDPAIAAKRIKSAVTDSGKEVVYSEGDEKAGIRNLLTIYSSLTDVPVSEIESSYAGKGYADFKKDLADIVVQKLTPIKNKHDELMKNKDYLESVLKKNAAAAQEKAYRVLNKVYRKVGLVQTAR